MKIIYNNTIVEDQSTVQKNILQDLTVTGNISSNGTFVLDTSGSNTAFKIIQRGSGDVLRVQDQQDPDVSVFKVDKDGNVETGGNLTNKGSSYYLSPVNAANDFFIKHEFNGSEDVFSSNIGALFELWKMDFTEAGYPIRLFNNKIVGSLDTGNIGIGTENLQEKLTVSGNISASGNVYATNIEATNLTLAGNLSVQGTTTQIDTTIVGTSAMSIDTNSSETALRITQRGSGDVLRVEDSANPDTTPFIIKPDGKVGIGTANPNEALTVIGNISAVGTHVFEVSSTEAPVIIRQRKISGAGQNTTGSKLFEVIGGYSGTTTTVFAITSANSIQEGLNTTASGQNSHAEGSDTNASEFASHAEGSGTNASGFASHAEGSGTNASGGTSHAEGSNTNASNYGSHAEGLGTGASGYVSHSEGCLTQAIGGYSHSEGLGTFAIGEHSHVEGFKTYTVGNASRAVGDNTIAVGEDSSAEGFQTSTGFKIPLSNFDPATNLITFTAQNSALVHSSLVGAKVFCSYTDVNSQVQKFAFVIKSRNSTNGTLSAGDFQGLIGGYPGNSGFIIVQNDRNGLIIGQAAHAEGNATQAVGNASHAEGKNTQAIGGYSHAEGEGTIASGETSHTEGYYSTASGKASHAEGFNTQAIGPGTHAQGNFTTAFGNHSCVGGYYAYAAHDRTWVWKGSLSQTALSSTRMDQFMVSAAGGSAFFGNVGINTDNNSNALTVVGDISATGTLRLGTTGTPPSNTTTPVAWEDITVGGVNYKIPLYQ